MTTPSPDAPARLCGLCRGAGLVLVSLKQFRFGEGFMSFMSAGLPAARRNDDGSAYYEMVCPACDGTGHGREALGA